jgi:hypothetical protein
MSTDQDDLDRSPEDDVAGHTFHHSGAAPGTEDDVAGHTFHHSGAAPSTEDDVAGHTFHHSGAAPGADDEDDVQGHTTIFNKL